MDSNTVFAAIEASQTAKSNGLALVANDDVKLAALTATRASDAATATDLVTQADSDLTVGITFLQSLLSTAPAPQVPATP